MSTPPASQDRDARRAQALRSNLRRRKAAPEPAADAGPPAADEAQADLKTSSDTISQP